MSEIVDIFDASMNHTGTMEREAATRDGLWIRVFHLWLVSPLYGGSIVWQLRSRKKKHHSNRLGMSGGGHLVAGESAQDGLREVVEELGLHYAYDDLQFLGWKPHLYDEPATGRKLRMFEAVHMVRYDGAIDSITPPDPDEVEGLVWISIQDIFRMWEDKSLTVSCDAFLYDWDKAQWHTGQTDARFDRFVEGYERYIRTVAIMAERLLEGRAPLSI